MSKKKGGWCGNMSGDSTIVEVVQIPQSTATNSGHF
jgi:hypothetical protein